MWKCVSQHAWHVRGQKITLVVSLYFWPVLRQSHCCCIGQASWPVTSGESLVSSPHLSIGFMWVLGSEFQSIYLCCKCFIHWDISPHYHSFPFFFFVHLFFSFSELETESCYVTQVWFSTCYVPGWLWTHDPPNSVSWVSGLLACTSMLSSHTHFETMTHLESCYWVTFLTLA